MSKLRKETMLSRPDSPLKNVLLSTINSKDLSANSDCIRKKLDLSSLKKQIPKMNVSNSELGIVHEMLLDRASPIN